MTRVLNKGNFLDQDKGTVVYDNVMISRYLERASELTLYSFVTSEILFGYITTPRNMCLRL